MANGAGLIAEHALIEGLRELKFQISTGERLDKKLKVDGVITALPMPDQTLFFPPPIALQVTTWKMNWEKRAEFAQMARDTFPRLAYMELCCPVSQEMIFMAGSSLAHLFCCKTAPRTALVTLTNYHYELADLDELLKQYQVWLNTIIPGRISGEITRWMSDKGFGFITATVIGPNGAPEETNFFVHHSSVDDALSQRLSTSDGNTSIPATFGDGGTRSEDEQKRKSAISVKLA